MKKKKPKKAKSSGSKSASKKSPISKSLIPVHDSENPALPVSEAASDAYADPCVGVVAQLPTDIVNLAISSASPSDLTVIVDALTDSPSGEIATDNPTESSSNKTEIAVLSADPSSEQTLTQSNPPELSLVIPTTSSSGLPKETLSGAPPLGPPVLNLRADADPKSSSSLPAEVSVSPESTPEAKAAISETTLGVNVAEATPQLPPSAEPPVTSKVVPSVAKSDTWCDHVKGTDKRLSKKGEAFTLPSGEACIQIPNSVIEKHRKSWEPFVIGQFYSDPPSQGTLHNIVNGIWSKQYLDIAVSKMEGFAFLFRIPNASTRSRVIKQKLWQIEGQTMFVDKWETGIVPEKPELTSAPIWLKLRKVPLQFFNEDGLERIAGLVGDPKYLHPMTANKTNLEVAKVFTVIDPRKPLPEAVNVQFQSGEISRVLVSCPWMPPVCETCKEVGHVSKRCPQAPKACSFCQSTDHASAKCPKKSKQEPRGRKTRRSKSKDKQKWVAVDPSLSEAKHPQGHNEKNDTEDHPQPQFNGEPIGQVAINKGQLAISFEKKLGTKKDQAKGETSGTKQMPQGNAPQGNAPLANGLIQRGSSGLSNTSLSDLQPDSSDIETSDSELEEGEFSRHEPDFEVVRPKKSFSGRKGKRGRGPNSN